MRCANGEHGDAQPFDDGPHGHDGLFFRTRCCPEQVPSEAGKIGALSARKRWDREDLLAVNHAPDRLNRGPLAWQRHQLLPLTATASQRLRALRSTAVRVGIT